MYIVPVYFYPHADGQAVNISVTVYLGVGSNFVRLRISPLRIKLAASNFARRFIGVQGRESPVLGNIAPQKPKYERIGQRAHRSINRTGMSLA